VGLAECSTTAVCSSGMGAVPGDKERWAGGRMAKASSSDAYVSATHRSVQLFRRHCFTWEMKKPPSFFKRARATPSCSARPAPMRRVIDMVESIRLSRGDPGSGGYRISTNV